MAVREFETGRRANSIEDYIPGSFIVDTDCSGENNHEYAKVITKEEYTQKGGKLYPEINGELKSIYAETARGICSYDIFPLLGVLCGPNIIEKQEIIKNLQKQGEKASKEIEFFEKE